MLMFAELGLASISELEKELAETLLYVQKMKLRKSLSASVDLSELRARKKYLARVRFFSKKT